MIKPQNQQRAYYRVNTMLPFSYRVLNKEDIQNPMPATLDTLFISRYFPSPLHDIESRIQHTIKDIEGKSTVMAHALHAINDKLNFVMHSMGEDAFKHTLPMVEINISAGGMLFQSTQNIAPDSQVDVIFFLNIHNDPVLIRTRVVNVMDNGDHTFSVAVEFVQMSEDRRRQLVNFIQTTELEITKLSRKT